MRRLLAILIAVFITAGCIPAGFAAEAEVSGDVSRAVEFGFSLGVLENDKFGNFNLEISATRADFAKMLLKILAVGEIAPTGNVFGDVPADHPAAGAVETLTRMGIFKGNADNTFRPSEYITYRDAVTAMVRALGYEEYAQYKGGWFSGYYQLAVEAGLLEGIPFVQDKDITNGDMAVLLRNFMDCEVFEVVAVSGDEIVRRKTEGKTVLSEYRGILTIEGVVDANRLTTLEKAEINVGNFVSIDGKALISMRYDMTDLLGYRVTAYYDKETEEIISYKLSKKNKELVLTGDNYPQIKDGNVEYEIDGKEYVKKLSSTAAYIYNGRALSTYNEKQLKVTDGEMKLVDNDGNGQYDLAIITSYRTGVIERLIPESELIYFTDGTQLKLSSFELYEIFDSEGEQKTYMYLHSGDCLLIGEDDVKAYVKIIYSQNKKTGTVSGLTSDETKEYIEFADGEVYELTSDFKVNNPYVKPGSNGTFYFDALGRIAGYRAARSDEYTYGYIITGKLINQSLQYKLGIKLVNEDNEIVNAYGAKRINVDGVDYDDHLKAAANLKPEENVIPGQIIRYRLNENGEITHLNTPAPDKTVFEECDEQFHVAVDSSTATKTFYTSSMQFQGEIYLSTNCTVFFIPTDASNHNEDHYRSVSTNSIGNGNNVRFVAYGTDPEEVQPDAVVIKRNVSGGGASYDQYERPCVIEKITKVKLENGDSAHKVYYYSKGGYLWAYTIDDKVMEGRGAGDVMMLNVDGEGKIDDYKLFYDYQNDMLARRVNAEGTSELIPGNGMNMTGKNGGHRAVMGDALKLYSNLIAMNIGSDPENASFEDKTFEYHRFGNTVYTVTKRGDNIKVEVGKASDVKEYSADKNNFSRILAFSTYSYDYDTVIYNEE